MPEEPALHPCAELEGGDLEADDAAIQSLLAAATALGARDRRALCERIPLEQVERELARVIHIEIASILVRARELVHPPRVGSEALVRALQSEARETIDVARACGVRVPRVVLRLIAGDVATWPSSARMERWARLLDPDVELHLRNATR
jgi:hypothetical protein